MFHPVNAEYHSYNNHNTFNKDPKVANYNSWMNIPEDYWGVNNEIPPHGHRDDRRQNSLKINSVGYNFYGNKVRSASLKLETKKWQAVSERWMPSWINKSRFDHTIWGWLIKPPGEDLNRPPTLRLMARLALSTLFMLSIFLLNTWKGFLRVTH